MHISHLDCTSSVSTVITDLKKLKSCIRAVESELGSVAPRQYRLVDAVGRATAMASARVCLDLLRVVPAWPTGWMAMNSTLPPPPTHTKAIPYKREVLEDIVSFVGFVALSLSPIYGDKITILEILVNRHGVYAAYSWPRVIPKTSYLLCRVAFTRTRTTVVATLRSRTTAPLLAAAIRGYATAADVAPSAVGITVEGVYEVNS